MSHSRVWMTGRLVIQAYWYRVNLNTVSGSVTPQRLEVCWVFSVPAGRPEGVLYTFRSLGAQPAVSSVKLTAISSGTSALRMVCR